jgi:DNA mismatch repair protein MutS
MSKTPMMVQYHAIKKKYSDAILFFRLGDFYEMFYDDAVLAAKELSLTLTARGKDHQRVPMCGVPFHSAENYISKLVKTGYKVAICEQLDPVGKGPTPREVVRVISPGTAQLDAALDATTSNYLVAISEVNQRIGFACVDVSTGHFTCHVFDTLQAAKNEIIRCGAIEVYVDEGMYSAIDHPLKRSFFQYSIKQAEAAILQHFNISSVSVFRIDKLSCSFPAIVAILDVLNQSQLGGFKHIQKIVPHLNGEVCLFDQGVMDHLDFFSKKVGLFSFLNHTKTSMGARRLKQWLRYPLIDIQRIQDRQKKVSHLVNNPLFLRGENPLDNINDIERLVARICARYNNPNDVNALKNSLNVIPGLLSAMQALGSLFEDMATALKTEYYGELEALAEHLTTALNDVVPNHCREGGIFRPGYSVELDDLCQSFKDVREWVYQLEPTLRSELSIKSLKVGFNKVFGYYIEVPNAQKDKVPQDFIRKQTLANAERFITAELKEKETIILNAKDEQSAIEKKEYEQLVQRIECHAGALQRFSNILADMDALRSLASCAVQHALVCPKIDDANDQHLNLDGVWHPMVATQSNESFIKNSVSLTKHQPFMLITGPNMAGKSTVMRSVAICIIMGQMGGFVPAVAAEFSVVQSVYTRIGANDHLSKGQSTFMVEMIETAVICQNATSKSLILLDEVGRGTSTFDGVSIAAAVTEYLVTSIGARTFFATHYHELTALSQKYPQIQNARMHIKDANDALIFTYKLIPGPAEKSYGVMVAKMAGLPKEVTQKAEQWLNKFESDALTGDIHQLSLF